MEAVEAEVERSSAPAFVQDLEPSKVAKTPDRDRPPNPQISKKSQKACRGMVASVSNPARPTVHSHSSSI
eukprot:1332545-Amphidinium_carterae.1